MSISELCVRTPPRAMPAHTTRHALNSFLQTHATTIASDMYRTSAERAAGRALRPASKTKTETRRAEWRDCLLICCDCAAALIYSALTHHPRSARSTSALVTPCSRCVLLSSVHGLLMRCTTARPVVWYSSAPPHAQSHAARGKCTGRIRPEIWSGWSEWKSFRRWRPSAQ